MLSLIKRIAHLTLGFFLCIGAMVTPLVALFIFRDILSLTSIGAVISHDPPGSYILDSALTLVFTLLVAVSCTAVVITTVYQIRRALNDGWLEISGVACSGLVLLPLALIFNSLIQDQVHSIYQTIEVLGLDNFGSLIKVESVSGMLFFLVLICTAPAQISGAFWGATKILRKYDEEEVNICVAPGSEPGLELKAEIQA